MGTPLFSLMDFAFCWWKASTLTVRVHGVETVASRMGKTRIEQKTANRIWPLRLAMGNAPVSTEVQFQLRDFASYRSMARAFTQEWKMLAHENGAVRNDKKTNWSAARATDGLESVKNCQGFQSARLSLYFTCILGARRNFCQSSYDKEISAAVAPHRVKLCKVQYWPTSIALITQHSLTRKLHHKRT